MAVQTTEEFKNGGATSYAITIEYLKASDIKVRIDGAEVSQYNREELGKHIGYLPQDIELFEGTIAENIARFQEANPEEIIEAAKMAEVHELILNLPNGYETKIGPGGANLSGGQKQRIAIDVNCTSPAIVEDYISLQSGDTITKVENNTSIITYHDVNGVKKVCLKYGKADILREEGK